MGVLFQAETSSLHKFQSKTYKLAIKRLRSEVSFIYVKLRLRVGEGCPNLLGCLFHGF